jgi:hypothetical protein
MNEFVSLYIAKLQLEQLRKTRLKHSIFLERSCKSKKTSREIVADIINSPSGFTDLFAAVYSVDVIVNQRQYHLAKAQRRKR